MTPPQAQPVSVERPLSGTAIAAGAPAGAEGPFVINLRSSTTPMALSQPSDPALARFKFFMSRRLEDGRERFRLHMGYFETLAEAEEWLAVVREIYPGAWAGEAPGKRLKARAPEPAGAAGAVSGAAAAAAGLTAAAPPPAAPPRTAPPAQPSELQSARRQAAAIGADSARAPAHPAAPHAASAIPSNVPVLRPAAAQAPVESRPTAREGQRDGRGGSSAPALAAKPATAAKPAAAAKSVATAKSAAAPKPAAAQKPAVAVKPTAGSKAKAGAARLPLSNVREVLAALDETGATRQMPALAADKPAQPEAEHSLSDTQVLKLLESRRADGGPADVDRGISLLKPEDTGTRRALKEAVATNAPVSFAVQLQWSVQSIDISKVPPLAIFSAYTLYTVEGSREGRRWYGLRLGFFSDAISAKQVAHYVRSEFNSVAVVPVSPQERSRASEGKKGEVNGPKAAAWPLRDRLPEPTGEFKLIDDEPVVRRPPPAPAKPASKAGSAAATAVAKAGGAPSKRGPRTPAGRVRARDRRSPETLEETLEILGADQLEIDQGSGETLNDTGVRHLSVQVRKNTPFTRLLDRLAERARGR